MNSFAPISLAFAVTTAAMVTGGCNSHKNSHPIEQGKVTLEPEEEAAIGSLSPDDRNAYLSVRPLMVIRKRIEVSNFSPDESDSKVGAVQRTFRNGIPGWRMVLVGRRQILVFHVTDRGVETVMGRFGLEDEAPFTDEERDSISNTKPGSRPNPDVKSPQAEQAGGCDGEKPPS